MLVRNGGGCNDPLPAGRERDNLEITRTNLGCSTRRGRGGIALAWLYVFVLTAATALSPQVPAGSTGSADQPSKSATNESKPANAKDGSTGQAPAKAVPKATAGPHVLTQSEMQKPRSPFLMPPGSEGEAPDRYSPGTPDWREIPPWRQASFFGIRAQGRFFIYVIDCSGSMIDEDRFARATMEVRRSVLALQAPQQFEVIFYNDESIPMPGGPRPRPADAPNKNQLMAWLRLIEPDSGTDPRLALRQALSLRPEAVFLLSDGEFPDGTAEAVARSNTRKIPIHCVDMSGGEGGDHLMRIARDSGGKYASRPGNLRETPEINPAPKKPAAGDH
jgi:von Willebrand factor type A domain